MTDATANNLQRLHDLLSEQATAGLSDSDQLELQQLLAENASLQREGYELAAAAIDLALAPPSGTPLPERVRRGALMKSTMEAEPENEIEPAVYRLSDDNVLAKRHVVGTAVASQFAESAPIEPTLPPEPPGKMGWAIALAIIGVAFLTYAAGRSSGAKTKKNSPREPAAVVSIDSPTPTDACDTLISETPDVITLTWSSSDATLGDVSGDVRFSTKSQQGCLSLTGLPRLDLTQAVYQLWIIDADRQGPPVDAGLFEVSGRVTTAERIPFTPKLKVTNPIVFAITREPPGGVVTSKNQPIIVAKAGN